LLFSAVSLLFRFVEEIIPMIAKYKSFGGAIAHLLQEISWPHFWVLHIWLYTTLLIYCLVSDLIQEIEVVKVKAILLGSRVKAS
jgi:hypothetical protein